MARFACPICKNVITAGDDQRGMILACSKCGKKIRVPAGKASATQGAALPRRPGEEPRAEKQRDPEQDKVRLAAKTSPATPTDDDDGDDIPLRSRPTQARARDEEENETRDASRPPFPKKKLSPRQESDERPRRRRDDDRDEEDELERPDAEEEADADGDDEAEGKKKRRKRKRKEAGALVAVTGVIGSIGGLLFLVLFIIIISGRGPRWLMDFIQEKLEANGIPPLLAVGVTAAAFLIPVGLWVLVTLKGTILDAIPDELDFRPAQMAKFPDLDVDQLEQTTEDYKALGFEPVMDYTVRTELEVFPTGFARLLLHPDEDCYAEINQGFTPDGEAVPMRSMIASHLEDGWSLMTTDRSPSKESYLMRRPRALWRSLPDREPDELLDHHRKMRKKLLKGLDVDVTECSKDAYFAREREANRERKELIRGRWTVGILLEFFFFDRNPKYEWLGEYAEKE